MEGNSVKRLHVIFGIFLLALLLCGCGGGGDNGPDDLDNGPVVVKLLRATPSSGTGPLRVTFTVNISGGTAPYYYSWDYNNDGAVDDFVNQTFDTTLSVQNDYYLRASDAGGDSVYECQLKVLDSSGDPAVVPDPVTVTVLAGSGISFGEQTGWITDQTGNEGEYIVLSGSPVYFRVQPVGGAAPFTYQWDFDEDGNVDSTVANPQYTYIYEGKGVDIRKATVKIIDANSEKASFEFVVPVQGSDYTPEPVPDFEAILLSSPAATEDGVITLSWAPAGDVADTPAEPKLDLSVVISPEAGKTGVPPYEYYWDFENDGKFDSQDTSPTLPYYDFERKITINPYVHNLDLKTYTLRVLVIDSAGQIRQFTRTVVSKNIGGSTGLLEVAADYGFGTPLQPYVALTSGDGVNTQFVATFNITTTGSPGTVQFQFDANGDGAADDTDFDAAATAGWEVFTKDGSASNQIQWSYQGIGFYPAQIIVRTVDSGNNQIDVETVQMPLSIVKVTQLAPEGTLDKRTEASMSACWDIQAGGGNNQTLVTREVMIAGGRRGNTALRGNISVRQDFTAPANAGEAEVPGDTLAIARLQMNQERWGQWQWTNGRTGLAGNAQYFLMGGEYYLGGVLNVSAQTEVANAANPSSSPWSISYEMGPDGYLPLSEAAGDFIGNIGIPGTNYNYYYVFVGGVKDRSGSLVADISRKFISFDPNRPPQFQPAYVSAGPDIPTGRFDHAVIYDGDYVYAIGGRIASGESVRTVEAYDMDARVWYNLPPMLDMRSGHTACLIDGKIYVIGGGYYPPNESDFTVVATAEVYNPDTGTWSYTAAPDNVANNACAAALPGPGAVSDAGQSPNTVWYYGGQDSLGAELGDLYQLEYFYTVLQPTPPV